MKNRFSNSTPGGLSPHWSSGLWRKKLSEMTIFTNFWGFFGENRAIINHISHIRKVNYLKLNKTWEYQQILVNYNIWYIFFLKKKKKMISSTGAWFWRFCLFFAYSSPSKLWDQYWILKRLSLDITKSLKIV